MLFSLERARARNTHVEATLNLSFAAQVMDGAMSGASAVNEKAVLTPPASPAPEVRGVDAPGDPEPIPDPPAPPGDDAPPPPPADASPVAGMLCCKQNGDGQLDLSC